MKECIENVPAERVDEVVETYYANDPPPVNVTKTLNPQTGLYTVCAEFADM